MSSIALKVQLPEVLNSKPLVEGTNFWKSDRRMYSTSIDVDQFLGGLFK
jgi:hypothetical protein